MQSETLHLLSCNARRLRKVAKNLEKAKRKDFFQMAKPTKLWAGLGISDEKVAAAVVAHWARYQPRSDSRIDVIREIFGGAALRDVTLRAPLYDNAMKILAHLDTMPGGVVVLAHELGSKSQTLYYEGLCHTIEQLNHVNYLVIRISLSDQYTPPNWEHLLGQLEKHILSGLLTLCQAFLKAELKKILATPAPDFPAAPYYKAFNVRTKEAVEHLVFDLLHKYERLYTERTEANFWSLYEALMIFLKHPEQTLCYSLFLIDEAGEALRHQTSQTSRQCSNDFWNPSHHWLPSRQRVLPSQDFRLYFVDQPR